MNLIQRICQPLFRTGLLVTNHIHATLGSAASISTAVRAWPCITRPDCIRTLLAQPSLVVTAQRFMVKKIIVGKPVRPMIKASFESPLTSYLKRLHRDGPPIKQRKRKSATEGRPFLKGVVLKTLIRKPKKPNSANRKCVRVRLSTGREAVAYIPGIGHNLQEHHIVLVRGGRVQDLPGVKLKCVRGKYDLAHVKKAN